MAKILTKRFDCPSCGFSAIANLGSKKFKFLIYRCPECNSNVVLYAGKISVLYDDLVQSLFRSNKLRFCGALLKAQENPPKNAEGITNDAILDLKILLETEQDFDRIFSQL